MKRSLSIAIAAAALMLPAFAGSAYAAPEEKGGWAHFSDADRTAFTDARIAALKAGLKLTPDQEKNWPPVEAVIRENAKARAARMTEWREKFKAQEGGEHSVNLIDSLQERAKMMETKAGELRKLSDAAKPLYASLDDAQKHRLVVLMHAMHGEHHGWRGHGRD